MKKTPVLIFFILALSLAVKAAPLQPLSQTDVSATYDLQGLELKPGEEVELEIPSHLQSSPIDFVSIAHRQSARQWQDALNDSRPGYTSFELLSEEGWRCWGGVGSGPCNSKFAEIRQHYNPEVDNLYEWRKKGHISAQDPKKKSLEALFAKKARVRSLGQDTIKVHRIIIKVLPPEPTSSDEVIFSEGFGFGDFATAHGRDYPGRSSRGQYGNDLTLSPSYTPRHENFPAAWKKLKGGFEISLPAGQRLSAVDIAAGDMSLVPRGASAEQYRGNAKVRVELVQGDQGRQVLMDNENVGTSGVLRASPAQLNRRIGADEKLRITIPNGKIHILGVRVSYF